MNISRERPAENLASLAEEAAAIEAEVDAAAEERARDAGTNHLDNRQPRPTPARRPREDVSQVYSLRVPADRLEELRALAAARGIAPTALMRHWVLERLDEEVGSVPTPRP